MSQALQLPIIDLSSGDRLSTAKLIRQACVDHGFFYIVNHGVEEELLKKVFEQSKKFFSLPFEEKMKLAVKNHRGYTRMYQEKLDTSLSSKGDSKESFYIGPQTENHLNQWPSEEDLPSWRSTMEAYHKKLLSAATKVISLIALALNLDEDFFEKLGALNDPMAFMRLLYYPGDVDSTKEETYGASAHSDYGMITLLLTDGVPGLQVCREKSKQPQVWEDVPSISGALIVNIGDMMERWTNCLFRSTLHRVVPTGEERYSVAFFGNPNKDCIVECLESCCSESCPPRAFIVNIGDMMERWTNCLFRSTLHRVLRPGQERYSVAFFISPNKDCIVECLESCCSESCPPRFLPIRCLDYLEERVRLTYGS